MPNPIRSRPVSPRAARSRQRDDLGGLVQQLAPSTGQHAARLGQPHVAIAAHEQSRADLFLHAADPFAERRLRHVQPLGRAPEVQRLGQHRQRAEVDEVDIIHNHRLSNSARCFI